MSKRRDRQGGVKHTPLLNFILMNCIKQKIKGIKTYCMLKRLVNKPRKHKYPLDTQDCFEHRRN